MRILAIDLGKHKSVACEYDSDSTAQAYETLPTLPQPFHELLVRRRPDRVVIEICATAGWISDMCKVLGVPLEVANTSHDAWRWKHVKKKTDRSDALKLAQLSAAGQLPLVHVPEPKVRQWRGLIAYRSRLVRQRTRTKNIIRAIVHAQGLTQPPGLKGWTLYAKADLQSLALPLADAELEQLWRGQLQMELIRLKEIDAHLDVVERKLDALGAADRRVQLLQSIPGVGPRLSEVIVATIDDPHRFKNAKQVGAYAGLTPRVYQSGSMDRRGRISCQGSPLLRYLLTEVAWLGRHYNPWMDQVYQKALHDTPARRKVAIIALARRLLVVCWAMLRDGSRWRDPTRETSTQQPQVPAAA